MKFSHLALAAVLLSSGIAAFVYFAGPLSMTDALGRARAAVSALSTQRGDPDNFVDRYQAHRFDMASRERQADGFAALGHAPSGTMVRLIELPSSLPDADAQAKKICTYLEKNGFQKEIEEKFPLIARTDSHEFKLQVVPTKGIAGSDVAVSFSFQYTGFVRQGEPRKIADYGESIVRKEVNARCWAAIGIDPNPPRTADVSDTAVITDLPDEPDTAAAQAKLFKTKAAPTLEMKPPVAVAAAPVPSPSSPAPITGATAYIPHQAAAPPGPTGPAGSDLIVKKNIKGPSNGVLVNGMDYATLDDIKITDTDVNKMLDQGQKNDPDAAKRSPLDQPAKRITVQQGQEHPQ